MVTLQEQVNRAARGVTYYSPTRAIVRPQGTTANAGTAQRILQNQQPANWYDRQPTQGPRRFTPGPAAPLPAYTPPQQPGGGRTALDDILDQLDATGPQPEQEQRPGGWRGVLGTVANSVPGRAIFGALDILDRPRRAIAATVAEGLDALGINADSRSDGDASWSDWWNQFNDPSFGFGDIVASTGNKWLDRGIGLAGDLAMDPLNYLTGSGVLAGTGARMRVNLAARAFGAGIAPEVAARTGRIGLQGLSNIERRAINTATDGAEALLDRGYYWKLPFVSHGASGRGWHIPGSGAIEQFVGGGTARARNAIASTRPLSTMRYWRSERGLQDAIGKILTGRGDISFGVAAALVNYRKGAGVAANKVNGLLAAEWNRMVQEHGQRGLQDMLHEAETTGGTALNRFYEYAAELAEKEGMPHLDFPNYIPHVFTDDAINWLRNTPEGRKFHNDLFKEIDFDDLSPHMLQRKLIARDRAYVMNGVRMEIKEGSIREINEQFAKAVPDAGFKLLDDNIANISARYSKSMTSSVGEAGGLLYLANQARGLVRYADDDSVLKEIVDAAETRKLNVEAHKTVKAKLSAAQQLTAALKQQRDEGITALHGPMEGHLRKLVDTMDTLEPGARDELKGLLAAQAMLSAQRDSLANEPLEYTETAAKLSAAADAAFDQIDAQYQEAVQRLAHIEPAFRIAEQQWLDASRVANDARLAGKAGVKSPPMSEVQKEYRKGTVALTQLTLDRDAAASISQRIQAALAKERIIERNLDSDTFLARVAQKEGIGTVDVAPPVRYVDPETGQVQWIDKGELPTRIPEGVELRRETAEGVQRARMQEMTDPRRMRGRTPEMIYNEHNARRAKAIEPHEQNFPVLREYQNRIEAQTKVVLAAREDLFNTASIHNRRVDEAKLHLNEWWAIERDYTHRIEEALGDERMTARAKQLERELAEMRGPGGPRERAVRNYADAQRTIVDARQRYDDALAELERIKKLQNSEAAKIRFDARDIISDQIRGSGLRHIAAGREAMAARSRLVKAQADLVDYDNQTQALQQRLEQARVAPEQRKRKVRSTRYVPGSEDEQMRRGFPTPEEEEGGTPGIVERDAIASLEDQIQARGQGRARVEQRVTEAMAARDTAIANADRLKAETDALKAQRTSMDSEDYFADRLTDINERNRDVNQRLRDQVAGREQYRRTADGRTEQVLHGERNKIDRDIQAGDRQLDYWRVTDSSGPWRPVTLQSRGDGTFEVVPQWAGVIGPREKPIIAIAEKRNWFTEHFIDKTSSELDVVAADLMRAQDRLAGMADNRGGRITKVQDQISRLQREHDRLTKRLARFRKFAHNKYDREIINQGFTGRSAEAYTKEGLALRAQRIAEVEEMVRVRNQLVTDKEAINNHLARYGNKLDEYDRNIGTLRKERTAIHTELAETVKEQTIGIVPTHAETLYGRHLRPVQNSEKNALSTAAENAYGYKLQWEPVEALPTEIGRVGVWSPDERLNLSIAYGIQNAWEQTPKNLRTAEFKEQRDLAVRTIRELTSPDHQSPGMTQAEHHLRMVIDNYDDEGLTAALAELQLARIPFKAPSQRSPLGRALARGSGQGDRSPQGIANRSLKLFNRLQEDYGEKFVQSGAISPGTMQHFQHKAIELRDVMTSITAPTRDGGGASIILLSRRDQLAADLNRFAEVMFTYRAALEEGKAQPSNSLAAFIAHERLDKEAATVQINLDRVLVALGDKEVAAADAVLDAQRMVAQNAADEAELEWEALARELNETNLGRPLTEEEAKVIKNARAKYNRRRKALEDLPETPMASVLSDEVSHIAYIAEQYIDDISSSFRDLKNARSIVWNQASPVRRARQLEPRIEKLTGDIARAEEETAELRRLVEQAREAGENEVIHTPYYGVRGFSMTPQEVLDEIEGKTRDKITQQNEKRLGDKARRQIAEGNDELISWTRQFTGNEEPVVSTLYDATNKIHTDEAALVGLRWSLENLHAERAAVLGEAPDWINHYRAILQDQERPPNIEVLRGQLRDLEYEAGRITDFDQLSMNVADEIETATGSDAQRRQIQFLRDRIAIASSPPMTEGEKVSLQRKLTLYEDTDANLRRTMGDEAAYIGMLAARDDGRQLFTDVVSGARVATEDDFKLIAELFGDAEEAELSIHWLNTFNQLIDVMKHRRFTQEQMTSPMNYPARQRMPELVEATTPESIDEITRVEAEWLLQQLREATGESQLNDQFERMVAESVERTGWEQTAEELNATAAKAEARALGEEAYTAGERLTVTDAAGNEVALPQTYRTRGLSLNSMRNEIVSALIQSSVQAKDVAMQDAQRTLRLLGFDNYIQSTRKLGVKTMTGAEATGRQAVTHGERLSLLGYSISKEVYEDKGKLLRFVTDMIHGTDFDHSHALRRKARQLTAQLQRINSMRRMLGASIDESANRVDNPDRFLGLLAKWREPDPQTLESGATVLDHVTDFNSMVRPPEMEQVYSDRISQLQRDFAEAVMSNDQARIEQLGPQIRELHDANQVDPFANLPPETFAVPAAEATPTGTEDAAAQVAAEATAVPPENQSAIRSQALVQSAQNDVDNARAALAAAEASGMGGGAISAPTEKAPTQARTLQEFIDSADYQITQDAGSNKGDRFSKAETYLRIDELVAERRALPPAAARTAEEAERADDIRHEMSSLSANAWRDEPEWQVDVTEALRKWEKDGIAPRWILPTGEATDLATIERLRTELEQAEGRLAEAKSAADSTHLGPGDNTAGELADVQPGPPSENTARRAELQAQADAARAAGDENAARWAEQQMGWLDEPEQAAMPAAVDPVEQQGIPASVTPPDEPPMPPTVRMPDGTQVPLPQQLDAQFNDIVDEFKTLMQQHGPYESMPDEVKQRLAALSASARKLSDDRRNLRAADASVRQRVLDQVPQLAAYLERMRQIPDALPPTVSSNWEQVLRNGPMVREYDPLLEMRLKPKVKLQTGVSKNEPAMRMVGEVFPTERRPRNALLRGNIMAGPEGPIRGLGVVEEASLRGQLATSPRRIVETARERLIGRLNAIKMERRAAEAEGVQMTADVMQANVNAMRAAQPELFPTPAGPPELGPALPELSPDELQAIARGEYERLTPEWREAFEAEFSARQNLETAKAARAADVQQQAEEIARNERTRQLAELDMQVAKVRTDVEAASTSVADYKDLRGRIDSALATVSKEMATRSPQAQDLMDLAADIGRLASLDPAEANVLTALLEDALLAQRQLDAAKVREDVLDRHLKSFGKNPKKAMIAGRVMKEVAIDGWEGIATKLLRGEESTLSAAGQAAGLRANTQVKIATELRARLERVTRMMETPEAWKLVDKYTAFFKTYATGRPGFHVRNALSAIFMNMVDGVRIRDMYAGLRTWHAFTKAPREFWDGADQKTRDAITAVLASGAGGQFTERGIASAGGSASRMYRMLMNNKFTQFNQRAGTLVEGAARMGMAMNSVNRGHGLANMVDRITKYHFNYRELSSMDVTARRYIPFWTFMSRNLPLQLEQMWLRPQMYLRYQSLVRNFSENPDPLTPSYWLMQGAFTMNEDAAGSESPWYLAPDLPHLRVAEPFEAAASGEWGKALLSDVNPLIMAPLEAFAFNKKVYTGAPIEGEYNEPSAVMKPLLPILSLLGGTEQAASGQTVVDDRYSHVARSLLPPLELLERLTTEEGTRAGRQGETWLRTFGAPVLKLTPELRRSTARGRRAERSEQRRTQAELARL